MARNEQKDTFRFCEPKVIAKGSFHCLSVSPCGRIFATHAATPDGEYSAIYFAKNMQKVFYGKTKILSLGLSSDYAFWLSELSDVNCTK
jgi:hypothetical protein